MTSMLEMLWNDYFSDDCAKINTDEERKLTKIAMELHEKANATLNEEEKNAVEKYVDALQDLEALFIKKAFIKGCKFAVSFLMETKAE